MHISLDRVGQGFWVYGIQGHFKSGIQYFYAEKVLSILLFLNFRYKVYSLISFYFFIRDCLLVFRMISREILGILGIFFRYIGIPLPPLADPDLILWRLDSHHNFLPRPMHISLDKLPRFSKARLPLTRIRLTWVVLVQCFSGERWQWSREWFPT